MKIVNQLFKAFYPCFIAVALLTVSLASNRADAQQDVLRWKVDKGQKFKVELIQDMKQSVSAGGQDMEVPMTFSMEMSWHVDDVSDSEFTVTQVIERIKLSTSNPFMGDVEYDSDSAEELEGPAAQIAGALESLVGLKMVQTLNTRGETIKTEVDEEALDSMASGPMSMFANKESLQDMLGQNGAIMPEDAVEDGMTWDNEIEMKTQMGVMKTNAKYTYQGMDDDKKLHKIGLNSEVEIQPADDAPIAMDIEIDEQDNQGTIYFDNENGYLSRSTVKQSLEMSISAMGQDIQQKINSTVEFKLTPLDGDAEEKESDESSDDK